MPAPAALPPMPAPPAPGMNPGMNPGATPTPGGPESTNGSSSFADRLQGPQAPQATQKPTEVTEVSGVQKAGQVEKTNLIEQFDAIRTEAAEMRNATEKQVAEGKLAPDDNKVQLMRLFDLQTRAHDVAFRVELLTKVVEQGVKGVTQISATQA